MVLALLTRFPLLAAALQPANDGIRYFSLKDPEPEHGLAWFILNAFLLVAVAVGIMVLVGVVFGGIRLWLLEKFPRNRFNGVPDEPFSLSFSKDEAPEPGSGREL